MYAAAFAPMLKSFRLCQSDHRASRRHHVTSAHAQYPVWYQLFLTPLPLEPAMQGSSRGHSLHIHHHQRNAMAFTQSSPKMMSSAPFSFFALKSVIVIPIGNASNGVKLLLPASEDRRFRILSSQATELPRNRGKAGYHWNVAFFFFFFLLQTSGLFTGASVARYVLPSRFPPVWQRTLVLGRQPVCASSSATASPGPSP